MVTYIEISMKLGLINEYKVCFGALQSQTTRLRALKKNHKRQPEMARNGKKRQTIKKC